MSIPILGSESIPKPRQRAHTIGHEPNIQSSEASPGIWHKGKPRSEAPKQSQSASSKCYIAEAPQEFDEPGTELDEDAQVWKTYVKEADQVDNELVEGWNKSLDVILIFAALFSAISTAFAIEGYKGLKQDPGEVSAQALVRISLALVNGSGFNHDQAATPPFRPSTASLLTNFLWFLSLSLSVGVSLAAMLAKEWCFTFVSVELDPLFYRLDGGSTVLFAIGLCIFLWEVSFAVALPVIFVSVFATCAYIVCTVLPYFANYCPYGTVLSKICAKFDRMNSHTARGTSKQDEATARALKWMIANCETPRSLEVALQSIAAADQGLPVEKLEECDAWTLIKYRYGSNDPYSDSEEPKSASSLYARGLKSLVILKSRSEWANYGAYPETRRLELLVLGLQSHINSLRFIIRSRRDIGSHSVQKVHDICAGVGEYCITAARHTIDSIPTLEKLDSEGLKGRSGMIDDLATLMEQFLNNELDLEPTTYRVLSTSFALLLCCGTIQDSPLTAAEYLMRLLRTSQGSLISNAEVSLILGAFALCRGGYPGWSDSCFSKSLAGAERAVDLIWNLASTHTPSNMLVELQVLGVVHLLSDPRYYLQEVDVDCLSRRIDHLSWMGGIDGCLPNLRLSPDFNLSAECFKVITYHLSDHADVEKISAQLLACLTSIYALHQPPQDLVPTPEIYILMVKVLCLKPSNKTKRIIHNILASVPFPKLSKRLVELISSTHIIDELQKMAVSLSDDHALKLFALAHLWILITLSLQPYSMETKAQAELEDALLWYSALENNLENRSQVAENLASEFSTLLQQYQPNTTILEQSKLIRGGITGSQEDQYPSYYYRVLECILQQKGSTSSDPQWEFMNSHLERLPKGLRGMGALVHIG